MARALKWVREKWKGKVLIVAYLDDIIIFSVSLADAEQAFRDVQDALRKAGLELNLAKCELHSTGSMGEPTQAETDMVETLGIKNSPMVLEYLAATVSSFEATQERSARILAPIEAKMEKLQHFVDYAMDLSAIKPDAEHEMGSILFRMLLKSANGLDTFALRVNPTQETALICDRLNKMKLDLFIRLGLPMNEREEVDFPTFAENLEDLRRLSTKSCFVHGSQGMTTDKCDSMAAATLRRIFLPNRMGGGGLQDAWARSVAGYLASYRAVQDRIEAILPLIGLMAKKTPATVTHAQTIMDEITKHKENSEKAYDEKFYSRLAKQKSKGGVPRRAQRSFMDDFNSCGAFAVYERYETTDIKQVARFESKQGGIYHRFIFANQNFRLNRLTRDQHRLALCELIGLESPSTPKCSACDEEPDEGPLEHAMRCQKLGGNAIMGGFFKKGVVNGTRSSSNLHVPNFEPKYDNFGVPPPANPETTAAYVKKKPILKSEATLEKSN
jgi:hypothetical protein